jgi:hypothetical protein
MTLLQRILESLAKASSYNRGVQTAPAAILWTDKESIWTPEIPVLQAHVPQLFVLGSYAPEKRQGPAIWLKCAVADVFASPSPAKERGPGGEVPILYLPGVSRSDLRAIEGCPRHLQPLAELQYRGVFWTQANAKDWTVNAFLCSKHGGLGLPVLQDQATQAALLRALAAGELLQRTFEVEAASSRLAFEVGAASSRLTRQDGAATKILDAAFFDALIAPNPVKDLLTWMNDPQGKHQEWQGGRWDIFVDRCRKDYGFHPEQDGEWVAAEMLAAHSEAWTEIWDFYSDAYGRFPKVYELLERINPPATLFEEVSGYPKANLSKEGELRASLLKLATLPAKQACASLMAEEHHHAERRDGLWCRMGLAPLANALKHLVTIAQRVERIPTGTRLAEIEASYRDELWKIDLAALDALACVHAKQDCLAVQAALQAVYIPWLESAAFRFQELVQKLGGLDVETASSRLTRQDGASTPALDVEAASSRSARQDGASTPLDVEAASSRLTRQDGASTCIVFVDGLRYDVAARLTDLLKSLDAEIRLNARWTTIPTVTASGKAWVSPIAAKLKGTPDSKDFEASVAESDKPLSSHSFRKLLEEQGWQVLSSQQPGDPQGKAWTECGDLDHYGHEHGLKLARDLSSQLQAIIERIEELLDAGWKHIRIVTDHGWLLVPGGMPKIELQKFDTETRWSRCAVLKDHAQGTPLSFGWTWCPEVTVAMAPGIGSFVAGCEYGHGGLSLQESLIPVIDLTPQSGAASQTSVEIKSVQWQGLRCRIEIVPALSDAKADIRTKAAMADSSVVSAPKTCVDGQVSLVLDAERDDMIGMVASIVILDQAGYVLQKMATTIGGE